VGRAAVVSFIPDDFVSVGGPLDFARVQSLMRLFIQVEL
jgi:hypothetical protein